MYSYIMYWVWYLNLVLDEFAVNFVVNFKVKSFILILNKFDYELFRVNVKLLLVYVNLRDENMVISG